MEELIKYYLRKKKLSFSEELENQFAWDYFKRILPTVRIALILAFILYAVFGLLDAVISPETRHFIWFIRYIIICPIIALVFILSYFKIFHRIMQISISIVTLVAGFGIITMIVTANSLDGSHYYYAGLTLIIMWCYTFVRLRFVYATVVCWIIIIAYEIATVLYWEIPASDKLMTAFVNNNFFLISSNIIGMFVCYNMEIYTRRDFLQRTLIMLHVNRAEEERKTLITLSVTDPLTGAYNRRYFLYELDSEISRSVRYNYIFSFVMLDIDYFKNINDAFGHDAGDEVLKHIVSTIRKILRKNDILARWGGEEFMILLPGTGLDNARIFADKLINEVRSMELDKSGKITVSLGVTEYRKNEPADSMIKRVDELVYKAKNDGRNCIRYST